jgi:murein DD-endopeptidase MepM/ murein hydrolase activator NlpD
MSISIAEPETDPAISNSVDPEYIEAHVEESSSTYVVRKGDTLSRILAIQSVPQSDISEITKLFKQKHSDLPLKIGQKIVFEYDINITENQSDDLAVESRTLSKMTIVLDKVNFLEIVRGNEGFTTKTASVPLIKLISKTSATIDSNFIATLKSLGLSSSNIVELVNAYSYQIDFQRQIQPGDKITVITEKFLTEEDSKFSHYGKILFASLSSSGKDYNIYRYLHDNNYQFFSEDGKSVKRSLLRTPVKVLRVSSHYGLRKHPISGYNKQHKGVDFAAATGTPIYSAGDGVVTQLGWRSGYGKFIQIKHSGTLSTAYAHASNFAKSLKVGSRVKQGDIIAYVGSTGNTTGPHLHYEVLVNGKHVNPMSIKTSPGLELSGKGLEKFNSFKKEFAAINNKLENGSEFAENILPYHKNSSQK